MDERHAGDTSVPGRLLHVAHRHTHADGSARGAGGGGGDGIPRGELHRPDLHQGLPGGGRQGRHRGRAEHLHATVRRRARG